MVMRNGEFVFFRPDGMEVPRINDRLRPGVLEAEFGQKATALGRSDLGAALRIGRSRRRAEWEAFIAARQG